jgi:protein O-GlcNAc transferase
MFKIKQKKVKDIRSLMESAMKHFQEGDLHSSESICLGILRTQPKNVLVLHFLTEVYYKLGELDSAINCINRALRLDPTNVDAYNNLGVILQERGRIDEAIACYRKVLRLNPKYADAYYNLGNALREQGNQEEALQAYAHALDCDPKNISARWAWCMGQLPIIYKNFSSIQSCRTRYAEELVRLRNSISLSTSYDVEAASEAIGSLQSFYLAYQGLNDRELQQLYGDLVAKIMAARYPQYASLDNTRTPLSGRPLRIGIVSGYFYRHSNWKIPIKGWVENLDRKRFSLYGYYTGKKKDTETENARKCFVRFAEDIYSFEDLCRVIRGDSLDVVIYPEIGMNSMSARLAALRFAPFQCASWGHPDTTGLPAIDYYLSSDLMEPPDADSHYTEKLVRLPNLSVYYEPLDVPIVSIDSASLGLRTNSVLYLCCQSLFKYLPQYDEIYPHIARGVGNCQFLFISHKSSFMTERFRRRLAEAFSRFDLSIDDYVVFLPQLDAGRYNAVNSLSDIYLDSVGWSGCNSTLEAIACDLPVITLPGALMRGRHSFAILTMMGLQDTAASTLEEYIELAVTLGRDPVLRENISGKIAERKHLVYRDRSCIEALENFLEGLPFEGKES